MFRKLNQDSSSASFLLLFALIFNFSLKAQSVEDRVKVIRQMYAEVGALQKGGSSTGCKKGSRGRESNIDHNGRNTYQSSSQCFYSNGYSKVTSKLVGWEFETNSEYFFKNGKLFFVSAVHDNVCGRAEYRYYFDSYGRSIRILEKPNDCEEQGVRQNREIYSSQRRTELLNNANEILRDALLMVK